MSVNIFYRMSNIEICKCLNELLFILRLPGLIMLPEDLLGERLPDFELILHFIQYEDG